MSLKGRRLVFAMSGGIAAFKAVSALREVQRRGADVRVVMTRAATRFVGTVTLGGLTGRPPVVDLWDPSYPGEVHVELGEWADAVVVAPTTMNLLGRVAGGLADDAVLATIACARGPVLYAPAMHHRMWRHPATQRAVAVLRDRGAHFVGPEHGELASGEHGEGRMTEPEAIADAVEGLFLRDLEGLSLVVSAGPTAEDLDPVRFLSNRSTGRMGFAIAERGAARGAKVTLVAGPVTLATPAGVSRVDVRSARQMAEAMDRAVADADVVVMAAAVADYRPAEVHEHKLKKGSGALHVELIRNPDILAALGEARARERKRRPRLIGFALESERLLEGARKKLLAKHIDLVVANAPTAFGADEGDAWLVTETGEEELGPLPKHALADRILDTCVDTIR